MDLKSHKAHILQYQPKNLLSLLEGCSIVYIVSRSWWNSWCKYVGYHEECTEVSPGPIDNSSLVYGEGYTWNTLRLKPELDPASDIEILHPVTWKRLTQEYGGGPEINLNVIDGKVDLNPMPYEVLFLDAPCLRHNDKGRHLLLSTNLNANQALECICTILALSASNYDLQIIYQKEGVNNFISMEDDRKLADYKQQRNLKLAVILKEPEIGK